MWFILCPDSSANDSPCTHLQGVYPERDLSRKSQVAGCELTLITCLQDSFVTGHSIINPDASADVKKLTIVSNVIQFNVYITLCSLRWCWFLPISLAFAGTVRVPVLVVFVT